MRSNQSGTVWELQSTPYDFEDSETGSRPVFRDGLPLLQGSLGHPHGLVVLEGTDAVSALDATGAPPSVTEKPWGIGQADFPFASEQQWPATDDETNLDASS